jgi:hypothetical protein
MELSTVAKIAIQIMDHNPEDYGMTRSDFVIYLVGKQTIFHAVIGNHPQILMSKIGTTQIKIRMLGTNPIECYQKNKLEYYFL